MTTQSNSKTAGAPVERGTLRRRRGGRRSSRARKLSRINAIARERQEAWRESGRSDLTAALERKLKTAFADLRADRRNLYAEHPELEGSEYRGAPPSIYRGSR